MTIMLGLLKDINRKPAPRLPAHHSLAAMEDAAKLLREAEKSTREIGLMCGVSHYVINRWGKGYVEVFNDHVGWGLSDVCHYDRYYTKRIRGRSTGHCVEVMKAAAKMFERTNYSTAKIGDLLNVSQAQIYRWKKGKVEIFNQVTGWK